MDNWSEKIFEAVISVCVTLGVLALCTMLIVGAVGTVVWLGRMMM